MHGNKCASDVCVILGGNEARDVISIFHSFHLSKNKSFDSFNKCAPYHVLYIRSKNLTYIFTLLIIQCFVEASLATVTGKNFLGYAFITMYFVLSLVHFSNICPALMGCKICIII